MELALKGMRILVVEDDTDTRQLLIRLLLDVERLGDGNH